MPELDPVVQDIEANAAEYLAMMDEMIAKAEAFAAAVRADEEALASFAVAADEAAVLLGHAAGQADDLSTAISGVARSTAPADAALSGLDGRLDDLIMLGGATVSELHDIRDAMAGVALAAAAMAASTSKTTAAADAGTVAATRWAGVWGLTGNAIHWIVMGTLEIGATAIPALVALTAAGVAMAPTFTHVADQMNYLRAATGSWSGVMADSVAPLQAAGAATVKLRAAVAPDAYVIFGAAINSITGHVGVFSQMAEQASSALAGFATKLSAELSGPLGGQLSSFFANAVKYMIQWGQVLGNLGHSFLNAFNAMHGVGQLLLDTLVALSRALLALTSNPVGAFIIGWAAAMSALYRYSKLMLTIWNLLGGSALAKVITGFAAWGAGILAIASDLGIMAAASQVAGDMMDLAFGPVGIAIMAVTTALGFWYLTSRNAASGTDKLIASINKMPPTMANLDSGMQQMEGNLLKLSGGAAALGTQYTQATSHMGRFGTSVDQVSNSLVQNSADVQKSIAEMSRLANEAVNLVTGMAQAGMRTGAVGAAMQVMAIQTAIADSKIQSVNQAIDQYVGLLTGATSGNANFITSMANIGSVAATTSNNLGTATGTMTLNSTQFAAALTHMGTTGAAAWQNFDQVLTGSMGPMMDQLRQMGVVGALTGQQVSTAAIDMAVQLGKFAGTNKTAQASIMGFLAAQGLTFPSFQKFMQDAQKAGAGQKQLNGIVDAGTIAFSKLSQMAKNAANAMNPLVANAIDTAALKSSGFNTNLTKLQTDMMKHEPRAVIVADMAAVGNSYQTAMTIAEQTGNTITTSGQKAASGVHDSTAKMATAWDQGKMHQLDLQNQVQSSSSSIGSHTHSAASQVGSAMSAMERAFDASKAHAQALQNYIDSMHGKTITVTTNFVTTSSAPGAGIPGISTPKAAGGYIDGAGTKTSDSNLIRASTGEYIVRAAAVDHYGKSLFDALNSRAYASGGVVTNSGPAPALVAMSGGGDSGGTGTLALNLRLDNRVDGDIMSTSNRKAVLKYYRRNVGNNLALRVR